MIYGYNSKLSTRGIDTIMDYGREFMEEIKKVRHTREVETPSQFDFPWCGTIRLT